MFEVENKSLRLQKSRPPFSILFNLCSFSHMLHEFDLNHWSLYYIQCFNFSAVLYIVIVCVFSHVFLSVSFCGPILLLKKTFGRSGARPIQKWSGAFGKWDESTAAGHWSLGGTVVTMNIPVILFSKDLGMGSFRHTTRVPTLCYSMLQHQLWFLFTFFLR